MDGAYNTIVGSELDDPTEEAFLKWHQQSKELIDVILGPLPAAEGQPVD
ncbi:MAG: hypothetical protein Q7V57_17685 [Actinomycetota bacterium]|nr:hypothetical protein [Actinomycetota bacterium]